MMMPGIRYEMRQHAATDLPLNAAAPADDAGPTVLFFAAAERPDPSDER